MTTPTPKNWRQELRERFARDFDTLGLEALVDKLLSAKDEELRGKVEAIKKIEPYGGAFGGSSYLPIEEVLSALDQNKSTE
jgi:hypothetical protein